MKQELMLETNSLDQYQDVDWYEGENKFRSFLRFHMECTYFLEMLHECYHLGQKKKPLWEEVFQYNSHRANKYHYSVAI